MLTEPLEGREGCYAEAQLGLWIPPGFPPMALAVATRKRQPVPCSVPRTEQHLWVPGTDTPSTPSR